MNSLVIGKPSLHSRAVKGQAKLQAVFRQNRRVIGNLPNFYRRQPINVQKAFLNNISSMFSGDVSENTRKKYQGTVDKINSLESRMEQKTTEELQEITAKLQKKAQSGTALDELLVEAFAVVREASKRVLGLRPFDVQMIGGIILHEGQIAEMRTGEGKTLVSVMPAFLNALTGKGVHIVTVNDYLARRDSEWVGQVHKFLGLSVGLIQQEMTPPEREIQYKCDVTYVTNSELGFDYLRDNLAPSTKALVLRPFQYCIIDEVDSILIDEARTPLIISGVSDKPSEKYIKANKLASALAREIHYSVDEKQRNVVLTEDGFEASEEVLGVKDLYDPRNPWIQYIQNALRAKELFLGNKSYIVRDDEIVIVDEFTGRTMPGRRWSDGLHQAIEAKEGVPINNENVTIASISYQNFFRLFPKLAGMTGTAATESGEFSNIYDLSVAVVPTNKENKREDFSDVVFKTTAAKWRAVLTEIKRMNKAGRPVLVGTTAVETSEELGYKLAEMDIPFQLLNAKPENVQRESEIVAQSGRIGMVTLATNMAGRGTDILLGGNAEFMARLQLRAALLPEVVDKSKGNEEVKTVKTGAENDWKVDQELYPCQLTPEAKDVLKAAVGQAIKAWGYKELSELEAEQRLALVCEKAPSDDQVVINLRKALNAIKEEYEVYTEKEKQDVIKLGGLHVIGTERHESRRIDNQLRGRSGRQGDPGSSRFFLSMDDNLFRIFGGDKMKNMMQAFRIDDLPIESKMLTASLDNAQKKVESMFFDQRKSLFDYDQVLNTQRDVLYSERMKALQAKDLGDVMEEYTRKTVDDILQTNIDQEEKFEEWKLDELANKMVIYCHLLSGLDGDTIRQNSTDFASLQSFLHKLTTRAYQKKRQQFEDYLKDFTDEPTEALTEFERYVLVNQMDTMWQDHLEAIRYLRQAVGLRGYGQRDPLTEYKLEAYNLFVEMMGKIRRNSIYNVYMLDPEGLQITSQKISKDDDDKSGTVSAETQQEIKQERQTITSG